MIRSYLSSILSGEVVLDHVLSLTQLSLIFLSQEVSEGYFFAHGSAHSEDVVIDQGLSWVLLDEEPGFFSGVPSIRQNLIILEVEWVRIPFHDIRFDAHELDKPP